MKQAKYIVAFFIISVCMGCGGNITDTQNKECPIPPPVAIFKKDLAGISNHKFLLKGRNSEESMVFADSTSVIIFQSGCDKITQEYRFSLPSSFDSLSRTDVAVDRLSYLARLGPDYMTFGGWAQAIEGLHDEFTRNNTVQVEPGFYVSLDKLDSSGRSTLMIKLFQK